MNKHIQPCFSNLILNKIIEQGILFYSTTSGANDVQGTIIVKFKYKTAGKEVLQKLSLANAKNIVLPWAATGCYQSERVDQNPQSTLVINSKSIDH